MEVKRGKVRHFSQSVEVQKLIDMLIDVLGYPMHPIAVHIAAFRCVHRRRDASCATDLIAQT